MTIVHLTSGSASGNDFAPATWNPNAEHYTASMLKVACLYAPYAVDHVLWVFLETMRSDQSAAPSGSAASTSTAVAPHATAPP